MSMAARPAKRQRRSTIVLPDDDEDDNNTSSLPLRDSTRTNTTSDHNERSSSKPSTPTKRGTRIAAVRTTPKSSPEKVRRTNKRALASPSKSIHNFFGRATDEQRWRKKSATPELNIKDGTFDDDIVDDDALDDVLVKLAAQAGGSQDTIAAHFNGVGSQRLSLPPSSQRKFVRPIAPVKGHVSQPSTQELPVSVTEHKPWADRYGPENLDELGVHKKKVLDVQKWLDNVMSGRERQRLLVLKGPAGSGKTSTVSLVAKARGVPVVSWHNPTVSESGMATALQQFSDFLGRSGGFETLQMQSDAKQTVRNPETQHSIILVEEFPAAMTRSSSTLDSFRSVLLQYLASSGQSTQYGSRISSLQSHPPVVMIISETLLSSSTALADSFTAHRLLGPELSTHPLVTVIEYNPVAPTFVQKALDLVIKKEARDSRRRRMPGPAVISRLAEIGDIRSAINSLEFFCARGDDSADWSGTVATRAKRKEAIPLTEMEKNTLQLVSQRESTLDMFHATGKIVHNKREDPRVLDSRAEPPPKPPDHLMHLYTSKKSQVDIEALLNETGTDIQTFISTLHENYVLSCNGDDFVDSLADCSRSLSDSDILNPDSRSLVRSKGNARISAGNMQSGNSDMLRQDEISFQVASRGLLFSLPFPVHRAVLPGARKQDAFKMFYPASLRLWKPTEEIHDLLAMYVHHGINGGPLESAKGFRAEGVAAWRSRDLGFMSGSEQDSSPEEQSQHGSKALVSEDTQVLEILPFMTRILGAKNRDESILKKITQFRGSHLSGEEPFDEDLESDIPTTSTLTSSNSRMQLSQKVEAAHQSIKSRNASKPNARFGVGGTSKTKVSSGIADSVGQVEGMEKLYISDDDIQDD